MSKIKLLQHIIYYYGKKYYNRSISNKDALGAVCAILIGIDVKIMVFGLPG